MPGGITLPLVSRAERHHARAAIVDAAGSYTYADLLDASSRVAAALLADRDDPNEDRVAFLIAPGFPWVAVLWGIWRAGGIAVPLPIGSPAAELEYYLDDTEPATLIYDAANGERVYSLQSARKVKLLSYDEAEASEERLLP